MKRQNDQKIQPDDVYELEVYNSETSERIGHLGDIYPQGLIVVSTRSYDLDEHIPLMVTSNRNSGWTETLEAEAVVTGTRKSIHTDFYDNELSFVNPSPQLQALVERIRKGSKAQSPDVI